MDSNNTDYKFECYEEYYGTTEEIMRKLDECPSCGAKLVLGHLPDYKGLVIQETARCMECGQVIRKIISSLH